MGCGYLTISGLLAYSIELYPISESAEYSPRSCTEFEGSFSAACSDASKQGCETYYVILPSRSWYEL